MTPVELRTIANARIDDAQVLFSAGRFDGSRYLCGYAIELTLKARICETLDWLEFPTTTKQFENFKSFKTHKLDVLLSLSGKERFIQNTFFEDWNTISIWDPESRYWPVGSLSQSEVGGFITSTRILTQNL